MQAASDFSRVLQLGIASADESKGAVRPELAGGISFNYPRRPEVPILSSASLSIDDAEHFAIVGPSGSGKFALAALL
jgi:ATP-binding cassette subfamily B (MDR/TAP) protein 1